MIEACDFFFFVDERWCCSFLFFFSLYLNLDLDLPPTFRKKKSNCCMRRRLLASLLEISSLSSSSNNTAGIQMRAARQPQQQQPQRRATNSASASAAAARELPASPSRRQMPPPSQSRLSPLLRSLSLTSVRGHLSDSRGQLSAQSRGLSSAERLLSTRAASSSPSSTTALLAAEENSHAEATSTPPSSSSPPLAPNPAFTALGLPADVCAALAAMGIMEPTEIQVRCFSLFRLSEKAATRQRETQRNKKNDS